MTNKEIAQKSNPKKFIREFINIETKIKQTWHYDLEKFGNGPYKIETSYPDWLQTYNEKQTSAEIKKAGGNNSNKDWKNGDCEDDSLPLTQRRYWSESTSKFVGYTRARNLSLIR